MTPQSQLKLRLLPDIYKTSRSNTRTRLKCCGFLQDLNSSGQLSKMTGYRLDNQGSIAGRESHFSILRPDWFCALSRLLFNGNREIFPQALGRPEPEIGRSTLSLEYVKLELYSALRHNGAVLKHRDLWCYKATPKYVYLCIVFCHFKNQSIQPSSPLFQRLDLLIHTFVKHVISVSKSLSFDSVINLICLNGCMFNVKAISYTT